MVNARIVSAVVQMAPNRLSIDDVISRVERESPAKLPLSYIKRLTGVHAVYHRDDDQNTSDLAAAAARKAFGQTGLTIHDMDLLIFASASQDLVEPATSHIVANTLGARNLPVFDVKNACNSVLNGMHVATSLIRSGAYRRILIVSGEAPSIAIRWVNHSKQQFLDSFAGFSMSDGGAAVILEAVDREPGDGAGIVDIRFTADSTRWDVGTLGTGGSRATRDLDATYFHMNGRGLAEAFLALGPGILDETLEANNRTWDGFAALGMHQVSAPYMEKICSVLEVPRDQIVETIEEFGNVTSLSFPLQYELATEQGRITDGDEFAFIGFAGGISTGIGIVRV